MEGIYALMNTVLPLDALQFNFMKNAFLAILLLTPLLGLLGTMAVQQQMAFFSDALGHSALTGIGLGIVLGMHDDLLSMLIFGVVWAIAISRIKQTGTTSADTIISVFSSTSIALGLVILAHGGGFAKYSTLLIGDVLAVTPQDLLYLLIALVCGVALWAVMYNALLLTSINPSLARSRGIHTRLSETAFVVLVAVAVVLFMQCGAAVKPYEFLEKEPIDTEYGVTGLAHERRDAFAVQYNRGNTLGTVLCILCAVPLFAAMMFLDTDILAAAAVCLLLVLVACGVYAFVRVGTVQDALDQLLEEGDFTRDAKARKGAIRAVAAAYWLVVVAIFLFYTFGPYGNGQPEYSWFIWAIAGVIFAAVMVVMKAVQRTKQ